MPDTQGFFGFGMGYNSIFLMIMYCAGAALKKYTAEDNTSAWLKYWLGRRSLLAFRTMVLVMALLVNVVKFLTWKYTGRGKELLPLCNNNSPFIIAGSILLLLGGLFLLPGEGASFYPNCFIFNSWNLLDSQSSVVSEVFHPSVWR